MKKGAFQLHISSLEVEREEFFLLPIFSITCVYIPIKVWYITVLFIALT